jgi:hypothetical protein
MPGNEMKEVIEITWLMNVGYLIERTHALARPRLIRILPITTSLHDQKFGDLAVASHEGIPASRPISVSSLHILAAESTERVGCPPSLPDTFEKR